MRRPLIPVVFIMLLTLIFPQFLEAQEPFTPLQENNIDQLAPVASLPIGDMQVIDTSDDGQIVAFASEGAGILTLDQQNDVITTNLPVIARGVSLSSDGSTVAVITHIDLFVDLVDNVSLQSSNSYRLSHDNISPVKVMYVDQDQTLLVADENGSFHTFQPVPISKTGTWNAHPGAIVDFLYDENNQTITSYGVDEHIKVWSTSGALLQDLGTFPDVVSFDLMGSSQLAIVTSTGELAIYDLQSATFTSSTPTTHTFTQVIYTPLTDQLVTISDDGFVRWWDADTLALADEVLVTAVGYLQAMILSPSNEILIGGINNMLYRADTNHNVSARDLPTQQLIEYAVSPGGEYIAIAGGDGTLRIWSVLENNWIFFENVGPLFRITFSEATNLLVGVTPSGRVLTWSLNPVVEQVLSFDLGLGIFLLHAIENTAFIAVVDDDNNLRILDITSGQQVASIDTPTMWSLNSANDLLITGHLDEEIRFWSTANIAELPSFRITEYRGRPTINQGFDDQHFFTRSFSRNIPVEEGTLNYWRIPGDGSPPILEWSYLQAEESAIATIFEGEGIVLFKTNSGFQLAAFDAQGSVISSVQYALDDLEQVRTSKRGETIVTEVGRNELVIWQAMP